MAQAPVMIRVDSLIKQYGPHLAVNGISFEVKRGEIVGFLGPNGAGKSTTMRMLTCYLAPTSGSARVAGYDVYDQSFEVRQRVGYLPEDTPLYRDLSVYEYLEFIARVRGVPQERRSRQIKEVCELCGLTHVVGKLVGELSRGYRQRVGLAQAMVHDPDILILDEPTSGLDPNQIVEIRSLIRRLGESKTVLLSTHILPEVQATCSRVLIISDGRIVADGAPDELTSRQAESQRVEVELMGALGAIQDALARLDGVTEVRPIGTAIPPTDRAMVGAHRLSLRTRGDVDVRAGVFRTAVEQGFTLLEMHREAVSLEDVFRKLTRQPGADAPNAAEVASRLPPQDEPPHPVASA
jgi:ABC-2 type transport system ATP-binding protein